MTDQRMDRHGSPTARKLFESDTSQVGALGDIVEDHDGDRFNLSSERSRAGADPGESDLAAQMDFDDPQEIFDEEGGEIKQTGQDRIDLAGETDIAGTASGIARGFGSHLPQDLGADGFQIEEIPVAASSIKHNAGSNGELDDYDDVDSVNG